MAVETGFLICIMIVLLGYTGYRLFACRKLLDLILLALQVFAVLTDILFYIEGIETENYLQAAFLVLGILVPTYFLFFDFRKMLKRTGGGGSLKDLFQSRQVPHPNTAAAPDIGDIKGILSEKRVSEIPQELNLENDRILKNIRKRLTDAQLLLESEKYEPVLHIYEHLTAIIDNCAVLHFNLGNLYYRHGRYGNAVSSYRKALELLGRDTGENEPLDEEQFNIRKAELYYNIACSKYRMDFLDQAEEYFRKALSLNHNLDSARENIALVLGRFGRVEEAFSFLKELSDKHPRSDRFLFIMGSLLLEQKQYDKALDCLEKVIRLNERNEAAYGLLGKSLSYLDRGEEAVAVFEKWAELNKNNHKAYYYLGVELFKLDRKLESVRNFEIALKLKPNDYKSGYNLAVAYDEMDEKDKAAEAFEKVIEMKPDFLDAYNNLGILYTFMEKYDKAISTFNRGLENSSESNTAIYSLYYNLGITLYTMGQYRDAVDAYQNALALKPDESEIYYHMAAALMSIKRYDEAVHCYQKVIQEKPESSEVFFNLSVVYSLLKKQDIAIDNLRRAIELNDKYRDEAKKSRVFDILKNRSEFKEMIS